MDTGQSKPAYWAVLPAAVRYDTELPANAKLLYAELSALANFTGFCYAGNTYFAQLYGVEVRTVQRLLTKLCDRGYISVSVERDPENNAVISRKIYCGINPLLTENVSASGAPPPDKNVMTPPDNFVTTPPDKNVTQNNININNITPITPLHGEAQKPKQPRKRKELVPWKRDRFEGFWELYPRKTNKQAAIRAWDKLQASDELLAEMGAKLLLLIKYSPDWRDKKYIPHASTFLNNARWNDVENLDAPEPQESGGWADDPEVM